MWTEVELTNTTDKFIDKVNHYLEDNKYAELLKVIEVKDANNEIYKYTAYILNGNMFVLISQWLTLFDGDHFTHDSMIIGEIKGFLSHEKVKWWFE